MSKHAKWSPGRDSSVLDTLIAQQKEMMEANVGPKRVAVMGERIRLVEQWMQQHLDQLRGTLKEMDHQMRRLPNGASIDQRDILQKNMDTLRAIIIEKEQQEAQELKKAA